MLNKKIMVSLGAFNSLKDELSSIALNRLDTCLEMYSKGMSIISTGGWGAHFNITKYAHAIIRKTI